MRSVNVNNSYKALNQCYTNLITTDCCALRSCRILNTTLIHNVYTNGNDNLKDNYTASSWA